MILGCIHSMSGNTTSFFKGSLVTALLLTALSCVSTEQSMAIGVSEGPSVQDTAFKMSLLSEGETETEPDMTPFVMAGDTGRLNTRSARPQEVLKLTAELGTTKSPEHSPVVSFQEGAGDGLLFPKGSATISQGLRDGLNNYISAYREYNLDKQIVVEGHTCNLGSRELNEQLSIDRANAVRDYLVRNGLDGVTITTEGYYYQRPKSHTNLAMNRRVDVKVAESAHNLVEIREYLAQATRSTRGAEQFFRFSESFNSVQGWFRAPGKSEWSKVSGSGLVPNGSELQIQLNPVMSCRIFIFAGIEDQYSNTVAPIQWIFPEQDSNADLRELGVWVDFAGNATLPSLDRGIPVRAVRHQTPWYIVVATNEALPRDFILHLNSIRDWKGRLPSNPERDAALRNAMPNFDFETAVIDFAVE